MRVLKWDQLPAFGDCDPEWTYRSASCGVKDGQRLTDGAPVRRCTSEAQRQHGSAANGLRRKGLHRKSSMLLVLCAARGAASYAPLRAACAVARLKRKQPRIGAARGRPASRSCPCVSSNLQGVTASTDAPSHPVEGSPPTTVTNHRQRAAVAVNLTVRRRSASANIVPSFCPLNGSTVTADRSCCDRGSAR